MNESFLTIREAIDLTGKSESTMRRLIRQIARSPGPADGTILKKDGDKWKISRALLLDRFAPEEGTGHGQSSRPDRSNEIVSVLREQLTTKDQQLTVKDQQIEALTNLVDSLGNQLNERLRESNILMRGLQERFALPAPSTAAVELVGQSENPASPGQGSTATSKKFPSKERTSKSTAAKPSKNPERPGLFQRLFRS